jgi:peptidylprolyl isomerase
VTLDGLSKLRSRALPAAAALGALALLAGCGSSGVTSTITVGAENSSDNALIKSGGAASTTATTATTPTSGPLSTEPTVPAQSGQAPATLVTKDLIVGTGPEARVGASLTVNYVGATFKGNKVFDASWKKKEPLTFVLGKGMVISGWDRGLAGMKVGGRRLLVIPASLGYGAKGAGTAIPPNAALVFVVDLLGI